VLARVSRAAWRLEQAARERTWALVSACAEGISIRILAAAIRLASYARKVWLGLPGVQVRSSCRVEEAGNTRHGETGQPPAPVHRQPIPTGLKFVVTRSDR
jgi:hypothetical protein